MSQALTAEQIDTALDAVHDERADVLAQPRTAARCMRLAELADREASWWEALSEHSGLRVYWRAALAARQYALDTARLWRARAQHLQQAPTEPVAEPAVAESEAA